jgi:signal transduction histidine kinase
MDDEQIIELERLQAAVLLSRGSFHQFGNHLTLIQGYTGLLKMSLEPGSEDAESVQRIDEAARQAASLLDETQRFVRGKRTAFEPFDVAGAIADTSRLVEATFPRLEVPFRVPEGPVHVRGSKRWFHDALMHLVLNAQDAMEGRGKIRITAELEEGPGVLVVVRDSGPGIPEKMRKKVLEPGYTSGTIDPYYRTGLGLSAVRAIVRGMEGSLDLAGHGEEGLSVKMRFPVVIP